MKDELYALPTLADLLPQSAPMILIDRLIAVGVDWIECHSNLNNSILPSLADERIPIWIGIEFMAQTIAAFAGVEAWREGRAIRQGYLLGTRKLDNEIEAFSRSQEVRIKAKRIWDDGQMGVFECEIRSIEQNRLLQVAKLNVYLPKEELNN